MSEADKNVGRDAKDGKRRFKNGNPCPWNRDLVCWGYRDDGPWWVTWAQYDQMCKRHKIKPKTKKDFFKPMEYPNLIQKKYMIRFWNYFLDLKSKKGGNSVKQRVLKLNQEGGGLAGIVFLFTGTLTSMGRKEASDLVEKFGGTVAGSLSSKVNILVAGLEAGSKLAKAQKLGTIKIISEQEFNDMINQFPQ